MATSPKPTTSKPTRGGPRPGAGRPKGEPSKVIRLPVRLLPAVQALVELPAGAMLPSPVPSPLRLPLFGHKVRAGFPSPADDYVEAWLDLNEHLIEHKEATFFVQATGDSMIGAGIQEGTLLVVDRALEPRHNDIVIAVVDGELTVKRLEKRRGKVRLIAENPAFAPIEFKEGQELVVWGVVTSIIQKLK
ncbi:translesion error-prone DNA polymerase V autoproteolytic subunit [Betaproteobacteria bacterium SCN2]|nr:translesion error-prone DNA polymerase V autoproteolytic subunit [Betaproteobacteria bacterium SCN2]